MQTCDRVIALSLAAWMSCSHILKAGVSTRLIDLKGWDMAHTASSLCQAIMRM